MHVLQAVRAGHQVHTVKCLAPDGKCAGSPPEAIVPCRCMHCAACNLDMFLLLISLFNLAQGVVALLVGFAFAYFLSKDPDDLVTMNFCEKIIGCFCKLLPVSVRILTILTGLLVIFVGAVTALPTLASLRDCRSPELYMVATVSGLVWLLELIAGILAKMMTAVPAFLYSPMSNRKGPVAYCMKCLRGIGP